jgi:predicted nucleic acid-binding protein
MTSSAVVDACLIINWSLFSEHDRIKRAFNRLLMPEVTFEEIKSEKAKALSARWLSERYLVLTPVIDEEEVGKILSLIAMYSQVPTMDPPELYAFVLAKRLKIPLLTDNKAPKRLTEVVSEYKEVAVYDSLDILVMTSSKEELNDIIEKFMRETSFRFSKRRLKSLGYKFG